jgi:hypothetical protein
MVMRSPFRWGPLAGYTAIAAAVLQASSVGSSGEPVALQVKAAYLLHFAQFVYWPKQPGVDASAPLVFGVLGPDPMVAVLEKTVAGKSVGKRPVEVKQFASAEQIDRCDILFLPRSASKRAQGVLVAVSGKPVLTVSDREGFSAAGGMIEFLLIDDSIRFAINNAAVERVGLKLSSELLRVAWSINGREK